MPTAGQWFMISGALMVLFGLGLLVLVWHRSRPPKQAPRPLERIRLHELSLDTRPGPYGQHGAEFTVLRERRAADATRLDLRRSRP
jgi:hypothetical protein